LVAVGNDLGMPLIDLSHVIQNGMITYPGLPGPLIDEHLSFEQSTTVYAKGTEFAIGSIQMVGNTGTYLDTPAHRYRDGYDLSALPLERCANLPALVLDVGPGPIGLEAFNTHDVGGTAVLLRTGWDSHWNTARTASRSSSTSVSFNVCPGPVHCSLPSRRPSAEWRPAQYAPSQLSRH
jgi:arylformamidase